ncbi:hypothetical protein D7X33_19195 [Butyricicoccus sp. 1XD8-22]|nr:hypothetical protein D7X33_19195 [Butyricicoccus sp. 1XD8-22]
MRLFITLSLLLSVVLAGCNDQNDGITVLKESNYDVVNIDFSFIEARFLTNSESNIFIDTEQETLVGDIEETEFKKIDGRSTFNETMEFVN